MKTHKILFMLLGIISFCQVSAQNEWKKGISIGQSSDNSHTKSIPAGYIETYPSGSNAVNSSSINGFIDANFYKGDAKYPKVKFSIFYELHKNTLIETEQNLYQFGIGMTNTFSLSKSGRPSYLLTDVSIRKSEDKIEEEKGLQYLAYASFAWSKIYSKGSILNYLQPNRVYPGNRRTNIPSTDSKEEEAIKLKEEREINWSNLDPSDIIQIKHSHSLGIERVSYENLSMFSASFNIDVYPFSGLLYSVFGKYQILKFHYNIGYRNTLNNYSGTLFIGNIVKKGVSLNYKIDDNNKTVFSIGYEHSKGGNPLKGLKDNTFGQLTLGAKVNI
jgi:hypothetical protein